MNRRPILFDRLFRYVSLAAAGSMAVIFLIYFYELATGSSLTLRTGLAFLTGTIWDPVNGVYGVLPMLYGSVVTSAIALAISVPVSLGVAVFLSELSPGRLRSPIGFLVEMLAAVPSVIYGLWGLFILAPILSSTVYPPLQQYLGFLPIFSCPSGSAPCQFYPVSFLTAGIILAIMTIPIISAISRDALQAVPASQREAALALGATKSEAIRMAVLSYGRSGVIAAVFLGFGRAFGETMAVTMLVGNTAVISQTVFSPGYTLASLIANGFSGDTTPSLVSAITEAGLVLLVVAFLTSLVGRSLISRLVRNREAASYL